MGILSTNELLKLVLLKKIIMEHGMVFQVLLISVACGIPRPKHPRLTSLKSLFNTRHEAQLICDLDSMPSPTGSAVMGHNCHSDAPGKGSMRDRSARPPLATH